MRKMKQIFHVGAEFSFLLAFLHSAVCTLFVDKESCSFGQGSLILDTTNIKTLIGCASHCDRHPNCVSFEYSEGMSAEHQCRLSGKYLNDTVCTSNNPQDEGRLIYELVSTVSL